MKKKGAAVGSKSSEEEAGFVRLEREEVKKK